MKKQQLNELLSSVVTRHPHLRLIVAGSQALHGHLSSVPSVVEQSMEVDLLLTGEAFRARSLIEEEFGMESPYQGTTGLYVHPVGLGTITLPQGWEQRLVPLGKDRDWGNVWALEIHDLTVTKLIAGREKDFVFILELLRSENAKLDVVLERFLSFRASPFGNAVADRLQKLANHLDRVGLHSMSKQVRQASLKS
jgi:hypothetical protein